MPYAWYHEQKTKVIVELNPIVTELETLIARYLHRENMNYNQVVQSGMNTEDGDDIADDPGADYELDESDAVN